MDLAQGFIAASLWSLLFTIVAARQVVKRPPSLAVLIFSIYYFSTVPIFSVLVTRSVEDMVEESIASGVISKVISDVFTWSIVMMLWLPLLFLPLVIYRCMLFERMVEESCGGDGG